MTERKLQRGIVTQKSLLKTFFAIFSGAGDTVPTEKIGKKNKVQIYVSRIRDKLGDDVIKTEKEGYALNDVNGMTVSTAKGVSKIREE